MVLTCIDGQNVESEGFFHYKRRVNGTLMIKIRQFMMGCRPQQYDGPVILITGNCEFFGVPSIQRVVSSVDVIN